MANVIARENGIRAPNVNGISELGRLEISV
jgi:hypothetical protein